MPLTSTTTIGSTRTRAQRSGQGVGVGLSVSCRSFGTGSDRLMKHTADSLIQLHLPLHDDLNLRSNMINHFGGLKFGSILEKLDCALSNFSFTFCPDFNAFLTFPFLLRSDLGSDLGIQWRQEQRRTSTY